LPAISDEMGGSAHFLFVKPIAGSDGWLETTLGSLGYELVDLEQSRSGLMRVFIDKPGGITVDDCAKVSHHLTRVFAVEGFEYERLEVSSPGLDRPLKRLEDFARFAGRDASVKLKLPREGRRRLEGRIAGVEEGKVLVEVEGTRWSIAMQDIDRARLVPDV
jgi:ribosome maturation factor RimP